MTYEGIIESLTSLLTIVILVGIAYALKRIFSNNTHIQEIIDAEKERKAYPDIQSSKFTRLYTMPYDYKLTAKSIQAYCEEHFPNYYCRVSGNTVRISETRSGLSGEIRELYITHLSQHNISAVEFSDPNELEYNIQNRQTTVRSSIDDKGFSKDIREMVRHFQQQAISKGISNAIINDKIVNDKMLK